MTAMERTSDRPVVIYVSYDGMLEPLGESQVVAYLERVANDFAIHLISFEKPVDLARSDSLERMRARLRAVGITWHPRRYHKRPKVVSTLWDMIAAVALTVSLARRYRARVLHARSILCAAMLYPAKLMSDARLLVDIRGFWADERVDGGLIPPGGVVYRVVKLIERAMLVRADHIVTLTQASVPYLRDDARFGRPAAPISVIPTCADLDLFRPATSPQEGGSMTIGYVGQVGTWYMLDEMMALFAAIRRRCPDARLLIVNRHQQEAIRSAADRARIGGEAVEVVASSRQAMPDHIRRMDAGMALIHPFFSKIASAPTKLAEYLGCGVPVIGNAGCGDMARIIAEDRVGVAMADIDDNSIEGAAEAVVDLVRDPTLPARCVASARRHFALDTGAERYRAIYQSLVAA